MIRGRVRIPDSGLAHITVSNGREVVAADADGRYQLPWQSEDQFVFITPPSGYACAGSSWRRIEEARSDYDFELERDPSRGLEDFSFVHIADIHVSCESRGDTATEANLREDLDSILSDVGDKAAFIVTTGDLTDYGTRAEFDAYLRATEGIPIPIYPAVGNHDDDDPGALLDHFHDSLGPTYYSFDHGPVHFVVYDGVGHHWRDPDPQDTWLRADLDAVPDNTPVVLLLHYPWGRSFFNRFSDDRLIASFSGHWHCTRVFRDGATLHFNTPSLCIGGIDQSPGAYRFCTYRDGMVTSEIRALGSRIFAGTSFRSEAPGESSAVKRMEVRPEPVDDWMQFRGGPQRTGEASSGPSYPLQPAWQAVTGGGLHVGSPLLVGQTLLVGTQHEDRPEEADIVALNAVDGSVLWRRPTGNSVKLSPASTAGVCVAISVTGEVGAWDVSDGTPIWSYTMGDPFDRWVFSAPLVYDGRVYLGTGAHFVSLDPVTGDVGWIRDDIGETDWWASYPSPAGYEDAIVIALRGPLTNLLAVEKDTGRTIWANEEHKRFRTSTTPVVGPDGSIYVVSGPCLVRSFDIRTGNVLWRSDLGRTRCVASPALTDGTLLVPTGDGTLHALDATSGEEVWRWEETKDSLASFSPNIRGGRGSLSSPVVVNGSVYVGSADGHLYALDVEMGTEVWSYDLGVPTLSSPVVSGTGLWLGTCNGTVHAFCGEKR